MKIVPIPKVYSITIDGSEIITITSKRVLLSIDISGGLFDSAVAQITMFEPIPAPFTILFFRGLWVIKVDGATIFTGFADNPTKDRAMGGNVYTFNLRSVLSAWDVLLTNTTFGVTGSGADVIVNNMTEYLQYLINTIEGLSDISFWNGTVPSNSVSFADLYEDGILSVTGSTYLAEIQRACQALGFIIFADPVGTIRMIDALNPLEQIWNCDNHLYDLLNANFSVAIASIPATVLVNDDILNIGKAYGHKPSEGDVDDTNYGMTKLNNISFATTVGMKESALMGIAESVFDISRHASQILTFKVMGLLSASQLLGYQVWWTDSIGGGAHYTIQNYSISIVPAEMITEIKAYIS
jgi:hypothetical protein